MAIITKCPECRSIKNDYSRLNYRFVKGVKIVFCEVWCLLCGHSAEGETIQDAKNKYKKRIKGLV